jgi:hypothetical protein
MFVEGEVEVRIKDRSTHLLDDHDLKLWLQGSFRAMSCYRISAFKKEPEKVVRATVALKISDLPTAEREEIEARPNDINLLRHFLERMFDGKGVCRAVGEPKLRKS